MTDLSSIGIGRGTASLLEREEVFLIRSTRCAERSARRSVDPVVVSQLTTRGYELTALTSQPSAISLVVKALSH